MLRRSGGLFLRRTLVRRQSGPPMKVPDNLDDLAPGSLAPKEKTVTKFIMDKLQQAKKDAALTKNEGVRGAINVGQATAAQNWEEAAERQAAVNKALADKSPSARLRDAISGRYDPNDHFLLMDLDIDRDSALFGTTREEFYENIEKLKRVIIEYHRWERQDTFYKYGTYIVKALTIFFIYDSWEQERVKSLLAGSLENFTKAHEDTLATLESRRMLALERAVLELEVRPPNFDELTKERNALVEKTLDERKAAFKAHPMDTLGQEKAKFDVEVERKDALVQCALSPTSVPAVRNLRRVLLPQTDDWTVVVREEMLEYKTAKITALQYPDKKVAIDVPQGLRQQQVGTIMGVDSLRAAYVSCIGYEDAGGRVCSRTRSLFFFTFVVFCYVAN